MSKLVTVNSSNQSLDMFDAMEKSYKFSVIIAKSDIIPLHYRGKPENVFIAVQTAYHMNLDPILVMQGTYVVSGKLGMIASFAISLANKSGLFANGIRFREEGEGDGLRVTAYTNIKGTGEEISFTIGMKEAIAENWTKNPKYKSMPSLMFMYRSAVLLIRTHAPEVLNGMHTVDELEDIAIVRNITPKSEILNEKLNNLLGENINTQIQEVTKIDEVAPRDKLYQLVQEHDVPDEKITQWCEKAEVSRLEELDDNKVSALIQHLEKKSINQEVA